MKKSFANLLIVLTVAAGFCGATTTVLSQSTTDVAAKFVDAAKASSDSQLGGIASELTGKAESLGTAVGGNSAIMGKLNSTLSSLTGGQDSAALASAFKLASSAKLTPEQLGLAKQFGNLASAYVVQKNFATLDGSQGDVATIVTSLRAGKIKDAVPSLKNVATSAKLTDTQKQLITTITDKYVPGFSKASGAMDSLKKLPGF
jgi:hypothetical protein